jgi:pimeloyl-ACP methyl ester carboxylesterase
MKTIARTLALLMVSLFFTACTRVWVKTDRPIAKEYPWPEKVTSFREFEIHYIEEGAGQPIVFIHGLGGSLDNWMENIPFFAGRNFKVLAMDQPGFGKSSKPATDYTIDMFIESAHDLMKKADDGKWIVVGNSMGGMISLGIALKYPESVKALVLVDAAGAHGPFPKWLVSSVTSLMDEEYIYNLTEKQIDHFNRGIFYRPNERYQRLFDGWKAIRNSREFPGFAHSFMSAARNIIRTTYAERLGEVGVPTLVVWGKQDNLPLHYGNKLKAGIRNSKLAIMDKSSHVPMLERAEDFNELVLKFVNLKPGASLKEEVGNIKDLEVTE